MTTLDELKIYDDITDLKLSVKVLSWVVFSMWTLVLLLSIRAFYAQ